MKTQIIQLEPHDDTISVRDKMGWSQTGRVILVWPIRGRLLDRRLDLVLVLRRSQSLGVQIALVTNDREVRSQAKSLGIPTYTSIRKAQNSRWRKPLSNTIQESSGDSRAQERLAKVQKILANPLHRNRDKPVLPPRVRIGVFSLGVLAVLSIAAVLIPRADIFITPETRIQEIKLLVQASDSVEKVNLAGVLPVHKINTIVEGRASLATTGSVNIPTSFASGDVLFKNLSDQDVFIPAGTVVSTSDSAHRFSTVRDAQLPGGPGEELAVPIQALMPGRAANLTPGMINVVEGELGVFLTVENRAPITGGDQTQSPGPDPQDKLELKEKLISVLAENALQEIQTSLAEEDILLDEIPNLVNVLSESYYPPDLQPASELELILRLEFEMPYVSKTDQEVLAAGILDANLPAEFISLPGTMTIDSLTSPRMKDGATASWRMQLRRAIQSQPSTDQAVSLALGSSPKQAAERLEEELALSSPPRIETYPYWWPIMPFIPLRISIISPSAGETSTAYQLEVQE